MSLPASLRWTLLALAGLAVAVAIGIAAGKLTSERIGLAGEPLDVGKSLAPRGAAQGGDGARRHHGSGGDGESQTTTASTTTSTPPPTTTDDYTGSTTTGAETTTGEGGSEGEDD